MANISATAAGTAFIESPGSAVDIGDWLSAQALSAKLQCIVVLAVDRFEYTAGETGDTGSFTADGQQIPFNDQDGDARFVDLRYSYDPTTGLYENSSLGSLNDLQYSASSSIGDVTNISVYGGTSLPDQTLTDSDLYGFIYGEGAASYISSCTVLSEFDLTAPSQATPNSVAAAALSQVGTTVNDDGCWVLVSKIAAEAGASLPISSIASGGGAQANGEWQVVYNGLASADPNWASNLKTGDVVSFVTTSGGGHVTTVAVGAGTSAELVDNIADDWGSLVLNSAGDGNVNDISVASPTQASTEFAGVNPADVVVYRLDTPTVTTSDGSDFLADTPVGSIDLGSTLEATDPFGASITAYQFYTENSDSTLSVDGQTVAATSAETAASAVSLSGIALTTDASFSGGVLMVRAFNGQYWGDWAEIAVTPSLQQLDLLRGIAAAQAGQVIIVPADGAIETQPGTNTVLFGDNSGTVHSGGNDTILCGSGTADVTTSDTAVNILGGSGALTVTAGAGQDLVVAGTGGLTFSGGGGFDTVIGGGNPVNITGGSGGGLFFGGGNATITAGSGDLDIEIGGNGDKLYAAGSTGVFFGTSGGDVLMSSLDDNGQNVFFGSNGTGRMTFITGAGNDLLALGQGINTVTLGSGYDVIFDNTNTTSVSTITAGNGSLAIALGGASVDLIIGAGGAREFDLYNFIPGADKVSLMGYSSSQAAAAIAGQTAAGGGSIVRLADGSVIVLAGVGRVDGTLFS